MSQETSDKFIKFFTDGSEDAASKAAEELKADAIALHIVSVNVLPKGCYNTSVGLECAGQILPFMEV